MTDHDPVDAPGSQPGEDPLARLMVEIAPYCRGRGILTAATGAVDFKIDVRCDEHDQMTLGYAPEHETALRAFLRANHQVGLVLRTFIGSDPEHGRVVKEVRGWMGRQHGGGNMEWTPLTAEQMRQAHTTDACTGARFPAERDVLYCGCV